MEIRKIPGIGRARLLVLWAWTLAAALESCTVGPDFVRPAPPEISEYTAAETPEPNASGSGEEGQRIQVGREISAAWWELFGSGMLDDVLRLAIAGNRTVAAARATLAAAEENVIAARGGFFPQIDLPASVERRQSSGLQPSGGASGLQGGSQISNVYSIGPTATFSPDVFGGTRRKVEQQEALAAFQKYELAAAYLTLTGNTVTQAITIASLRAQIQATEEVIADDKMNLSLVRRKYEAGKAPRTDVLTAETQLAADRASLPALRQQLSTARHALSILAGRFPAEWSPPDFDLEGFALPGDLPLTLPSELVRQRPDILAAEAQLHASSAAIGVAAAQLYPSITLSASLGQQSPDGGSLFRTVNRFWSLAADLAAPIFHGRALQAQRRAAVDAYQASLATYQQTVLQGLQNVADTLLALQHDAELIAAQSRLRDTADEALKLQRLSYEAGKSDLLQLIVAERNYQQARLGYATAQAQRLRDTAQLFVALGGGWWKASF